MFWIQHQVVAQTAPDLERFLILYFSPELEQFLTRDFYNWVMLSKFGAIAGFVTPTTIDGTIENVNLITAQAALDLTAACVQLQNTAASVTNHPTI
jgi:hypothetical protein